MAPRVLQRLAAIGLGTALAVIAAELACRSTYAGSRVIAVVTPYGLFRAPGQQGYTELGDIRDGWGRLTINRLGLRGEEVPAPKAPGEVRVLCLGDSFVFGGGLADPDTYPEQAQRLVASQQPPVRFINAGGNGNDTRAERAFLANRASALEPDVVVIGFNWNDLVSLMADAAALMPKPTLPEWLRSTGIYKFVQYHKNPKLWTLPTPALISQYRESVMGCTRDPKRWEILRKELEAIQSQCKQSGWKPLLFVMPELSFLDGPRMPPLTKLTAIADSLGMPWVDAQGRYFRGIREGKRLTQVYDAFHPNVDGQRLMAEAVVEKLAELGWIAAPSPR